MKTVLMCTMALALIMLAGSVFAEGETAWFDMENCGFCKHLTEDEHLLPNCIWEHHKIDNGAVTVTTVEKEYLPSMRKVMAHMEETGKKMEAGEMVPMCGMCQAYGGLAMKGAKMDYIETQVGSVMMMTSDNPEIVAEIHAMTDKTNAELKKEMHKMEGDHTGHDHK